MVDTPVTTKRLNNNHHTTNVVFPAPPQNNDFQYQTERSWQDDYDRDRDVQSQRDNQSLQFNSTGNRSSRGFTSNYILNDRVNTIEDLDVEPRAEVQPEVKAQQTISESDVREIVQKFNDCINKHSLEKIELEKKISELSDRIEDKQGIVRKMFRQRENVIMDTEAVCLKLEETTRSKEQTEKQLNEIMELTINDQLVNISHYEKDEKDQKTLQLKINEALNNDQISQQIQNEVISRMEQLEIQRKLLLAENQQLKNQLSENFLENRISETKCQNCKEFFLPLHNNDDACFFHPGKLKFYSCRGCGADQYYNCCNRCPICSKGCKHAKHSA